MYYLTGSDTEDQALTGPVVTIDGRPLEVVQENGIDLGAIRYRGQNLVLTFRRLWTLGDWYYTLGLTVEALDALATLPTIEGATCEGVTVYDGDTAERFRNYSLNKRSPLTAHFEEAKRWRRQQAVLATYRERINDAITAIDEHRAQAPSSPKLDEARWRLSDSLMSLTHNQRGSAYFHEFTTRLDNHLTRAQQELRHLTGDPVDVKVRLIMAGTDWPQLAEANAEALAVLEALEIRSRGELPAPTVVDVATYYHDQLATRPSAQLSIGTPELFSPAIWLQRLIGAGLDEVEEAFELLPATMPVSLKSGDQDLPISFYYTEIDGERRAAVQLELSIAQYDKLSTMPKHPAGLPVVLVVTIGKKSEQHVLMRGTNWPAVTKTIDRRIKRHRAPSLDDPMSRARLTGLGVNVEREQGQGPPPWAKLAHRPR